MRPEVKQAWLAALRSGEYQQGRGSLHPDADTYCCLGVLCDLHAKATGGEWGVTLYGEDGYLGEDNTLPADVCQWAGLRDFNPDVGEFALAEYNDGRIDGELRPHSFLEIADLIEQHL